MPNASGRTSLATTPGGRSARRSARRRARARDAHVRAAGRVLRLGERVVEAGAHRERDDERGGGGEDRERGQRRSGPAGRRGRPARPARAARRWRSSHTPSCIRRARSRRRRRARRPAASRWRPPVAHRDHAVGAGGDAGVVGHEHDRLAALVVHRAQQRHHVACAAESRLPVGSSASRTRGRLISARAIATRCCWPPERRAGDCWACSAIPSVSSSSARRVARLARRQARQEPGQLDVVGHREVADQVEELEDEADLAAAHVGPLGLAEARRPGGRRARSRPPSAGRGRRAGSAAWTCRSRSAP